VDGDAGDEFAPPDAMLFQIFSADRASASLIPAGGECSVQLEHRYTDPQVGGALRWRDASSFLFFSFFFFSSLPRCLFCFHPSKFTRTHSLHDV
jgi:hypothetical protein